MFFLYPQQCSPGGPVPHELQSGTTLFDILDDWAINGLLLDFSGFLMDYSEGLMVYWMILDAKLIPSSSPHKDLKISNSAWANFASRSFFSFTSSGMAAPSIASSSDEDTVQETRQ